MTPDPIKAIEGAAIALRYIGVSEAAEIIVGLRKAADHITKLEAEVARLRRPAP